MYLDAVVGPWFLPVVAKELRVLRVPIIYVILRVPFDEALRRAKQRDRSFEEKILWKLYPQFEDVGPYEKHVIDISGLTPEEVSTRFQASMDHFTGHMQEKLSVSVAHSPTTAFAIASTINNMSDLATNQE